MPIVAHSIILVFVRCNKLWPTDYQVKLDSNRTAHLTCVSFEREKRKRGWFDTASLWRGPKHFEVQELERFRMHLDWPIWQHKCLKKEHKFLTCCCNDLKWTWGYANFNYNIANKLQIFYKELWVSYLACENICFNKTTSSCFNTGLMWVHWILKSFEVKGKSGVSAVWAQIIPEVKYIDYLLVLDA